MKLIRKIRKADDKRDLYVDKILGFVSWANKLPNLVEKDLKSGSLSAGNVGDLVGYMQFASNELQGVHKKLLLMDKR